MSSPTPTASAARWLALPLALGAIAPLLFRAPIVETDLWWHLASGREIVARGSVPVTDPFSFTFAGRPWLNHEWLWDAAQWLAYRAAPDAVAWLTVALILAVFAVAFASGRTLGASHAACAAAVIVAAIGGHWFLSIRPLLWTDLFVGVVLLTRDRRFAPWLWPALVVVWVNVHGGFVFGLGSIGLLVLVRTAQASLGARRLVIDRTAWIALTACLVAWLLNPWGFGILGYPLDYLTDTGYRAIAEWQAPDLGLDPRNYEGQFWGAMLLAAAGGALSFQRDPYPPALAAVTFAMAATSRRFVPMCLAVSAPLIAVALGEIGRRAADAWPALRSRAATIATAIAAVALTAGLWSATHVGPDVLGSWTGADRFPRTALRYLRALGPPERVLNSYDWGGYLMLHAPETRVFFDSRANTLYDEEILREYTALIEGRADVAALTARYAPDVALLQPGPAVAALVGAAPPWTIVYDDGSAAILLPPGSPLLDPSLPDPETVLAGEPGLEMILAARARAADDLDRAARHLERAIEIEPLFVRAYAELARVHLARARTVDAGRTIDAGVLAYPRQARRLRFFEAQAYLEAGNLPFAVAALHRAYPRDPFGPREAVAGLIARIEREIAAPGAGVR